MINVDKPVIFDCVVDKAENCFPMIPSGKPHNQMILGPEEEGRFQTRENFSLMTKSKSAYSVPGKIGKTERHIIVVWVDNEAGVLARIAGLFSGRGYNIESLAVAEVDKKKHISRITIVTEGTPQVIEQINLQLKKLVPVHKVADFKRGEKDILFRELALFKILGNSKKMEKVKKDL